MPNVSDRILLCATGLSPQVITETLFALLQRDGEPGLPREIHVVTTWQGAELIHNNLLDPAGPMQLRAFLVDFGLDGDRVRFPPENIYVPQSGSVQLDDIRTREDNDAAADLICDVVRRLTAHAGTAVHASIAGGRKTLGYYLGYAMSLFGRRVDELSHVLVSPPFEGLREFFYPPPKPRMIRWWDGKREQLIRTDKAEVTLASIPFVRLRHGLPDALLAGRSSFHRAVELAQRSLDEPQMLIDLVDRRLICSDEPIDMPPAQLALAAWMADRVLRNEPGILRKSITDLHQAEYLDWRRRIGGEHSGKTVALEESFELQGLDADYFDSLKSRFNTLLQQQLGESLARHYEIQRLNRSRPAPFGLRLAPEQIRFIRHKR